MPLDDEDSTWAIELESILLDDCTASDIYAVCKGKTIPENVRADVWQVCLNVQNKGNQMSNFNEIFDLPNQNSLREDVTVFVQKLGNDEDDKVSVASDLESVLTFYCKSKNINYSKNNGWIELLLPLLNLKLPRAETYNLFEQLIKVYVPKNCNKNGAPFHVLWLLLQYHEPELCSFLDTKRITPEQYCLPWFQSLFAGTCILPVVQSMWDLYFQQSDQFFIFFLALIMLINARELILSKKNEPKDVIIEFLINMPCALETEDVNDFCSLAQYYAHKTPKSFQADIAPVLFGNEGPSASSKSVTQALCLPVSVHELVENATMEINPDSEGVRFFLVDCRPADQYNAGHLSTAFPLDCNLMLQEPSTFATAVQGLLNAQRQALAANSLAAGEHLCILGSGRMEEDGYVHMVVASFLKRNIRHVSMLDGGYIAIHDYFGNHMVDCLEDHDSSRCLVCAPNVQLQPKDRIPPKTNTTSVDLFNKLSAAMRSKSQEVTGKLIDYIVNPNANSPVLERHVSKNDRNGKRYRNVAPVFSIDEDNDGEIGLEELTPDEENAQEIVELADWLKNPNVVKHFKCQEVMMNGYMHDAYLVITSSHLVVMRDEEKRKGFAQIIVRRPLSSIVKITAKKRHPELITFKYGMPEGDTLVIKDMDRFLIPNAGEATKAVSNQIVKNS
ncbi:TBC1 domain family member 23 [Arctopsyche grandis]|uniref:TBC1 domain family member 23 n=1 Tax=Arctopsyche grandis TaxID=121162 RepID=UPI00406D7D92